MYITKQPKKLVEAEDIFRNLSLCAFTDVCTSFFVFVLADTQLM